MPQSGDPGASTGPSLTGGYDGVTVVLTPISSSQVLGVVPAGTLTAFQSNVPAFSCLDGASLNVYDNVNGGKQVADAAKPTNCVARTSSCPDAPPPSIRPPVA